LATMARERLGALRRRDTGDPPTLSATADRAASASPTPTAGVSDMQTPQNPSGPIA
jgi:hypothetical protein